MSPSAKPSVDTLATPGTRTHTVLVAIVKGETDARKIAAKAGVGQSTLRAALDKLKVAGLVSKDHTLKNINRIETRSKEKKPGQKSEHIAKEQSNISTAQSSANTEQSSAIPAQPRSIAELIGQRVLSTIKQDSGIAGIADGQNGIVDGLSGDKKGLSNLIGGAVTGASNGGDDAFRSNLLLVGEPIVRKVVFNPKTLLIYDYLHNKLNYPGDMAAFLNDCVDFYCLQKGLEVSVSLKEAVTSW